MATPVFPTGLPAGYTCRPATLADDQAVINLLNVVSCQHVGYEADSLFYLRHDWETAGFNLETDTRLVFSPQGELVAYCVVWDPWEPHVRIHLFGRTHPAHTRRGISHYLLAWAEARARGFIPLAPPDTRVTLNAHVPAAYQRTPGLMASIGLQQARLNLRMVIDFHGPPPEPVWPAAQGAAGIRLATFQPGDTRSLILAVRAAFRDHYGFVERPLENEMADWEQRVKDNPHFTPNLNFLAWDGAEVVGMSLCEEKTFDSPGYGWVETLGVVRGWRRRGLAQALLYHSFSELYRRGLKGVQLGVDGQSLTGATHLYEKCGMHSDPNRALISYLKELRPGKDLMTQKVEA